MELRELARQVERRKHLLAVETSLRAQEKELAAKLAQLRDEWEEEQKDVERLERLSLSALFYDLLGKKEEKLEQEQREAMAAAAKYHTAKSELEDVQRELEKITGELKSLHGCEQRFRQACDDRAARLKATDPVKGRQIVELERKDAAICAQLRELEEAIRAAQQARDAAAQAKRELDSAEGWGTWDLLGGGLIADMVKHDHLDNAQFAINHLQTCLRTLKTELVDVRIHANLEVNTDDFLRFADWFFDGLFADWAMQDRINSAQAKIYGIADQINGIETRLRAMERDGKERRQAIQKELDALVLS